MSIPEFKQDYFHRDWGDRQFPVWEEVPPSDARSLIARITSTFDSGREDLLVALKCLWESATSDDVAGADAEGFCFQETLRRLGVCALEKVYVLWWNSGEIDVLALDDLSTYWEYLWYPGSDWIFVFDDSFAWVVIVGPRGQVWFRKKSAG